MFSSIYHYVSFTGGHAETTGADGDIPCWYKSVLPTRPGNSLFQIIVYTIVLCKYRNVFYCCMLHFHCSQNFDWEYARLTLETFLFVDNA